MSTLCDVNFLIALCYDGHVHHRQALDWLDQQGELEVVICRNTQLGLLRLLSNPAVMGVDVCTQEQAWAVYDAITSDGRFEFSLEPQNLEDYLRKYSASGQVSPKLWQDAYLAAYARAGNLRLVTFDQGFRRFEGLQCVLLG
jgi:hypothetical protein